VKEGTILSIISKAKAKGHDSAELVAQLRLKSQESKKPHTASAPPNDVEYLAADIYEQYERTLRRNNSLDFDDLLLFGVKLFREHKKTVSWCEYVLVDEL
jgi:DNA helicase-2/ATP-dependent DNA helicase PcrA